MLGAAESERVRAMSSSDDLNRLAEVIFEATCDGSIEATPIELEFEFDQPRWYDGGWFYRSPSGVGIWLEDGGTTVRVYEFSPERVGAEPERLYETVLQNESAEHPGTESERAGSLDPLDGVTDEIEASERSVVLTIY